MTRFLVLLTEEQHFERWAAADEAEQERHLSCYREFSQAVAARGRVVGGQALTPPATARTVRPGARADRPVTEGPYAESAEQLGGYYLVELPDLATAVELARLFPPEYAVEVRECLDVEVT
jgi:hypothetical protein